MDIRELPVYVYTIKNNRERQENISKTLRYLGFKSYTLLIGGEGKKHYWQNIHDDFLNILQLDLPFLFLEDDIEPNYFTPIIEVPLNAQLAYLGGTKNGELYNTYNTDLKHTRFANTPFPMVYQDMEGDWIRPMNMHSTHAVMFLDRKTNNELAKKIDEGRDYAVDIIIARNMWRYNTYLLKRPIFFQNDKLNNEFTTNYYGGR